MAKTAEKIQQVRDKVAFTLLADFDFHLCSFEVVYYCLSLSFCSLQSTHINWTNMLA